MKRDNNRIILTLNEAKKIMNLLYTLEATSGAYDEEYTKDAQLGEIIMQISITEDEIKAIDFGLEQIREALEGSSDDDYKKCADEAINKLESISRKYHLAREKANELNEAKRYIRSRNGYMPPTKLDKIARLLVKKTKEHENGNTEEKQL